MNTYTFQIELIPSFCNNWPELSIEINNTTLWQGFVDKPQSLSVEFDPEPLNNVYIRYLNKQMGPELWDTEVDGDGNILKDQYCKLTNFKIANSRCDFLLRDLDYFYEDGTIEKAPWGFMSRRGYFYIEFPKNIYNWIIQNRMRYLGNHSEKSSSLDYWNNYLGDPNDTVTQNLLKDIKKLLITLKND
jgi:hypothetical protein